MFGKRGTGMLEERSENSWKIDVRVCHQADIREEASLVCCFFKGDVSVALV